jgi:hypothetical protein
MNKKVVVISLAIYIASTVLSYFLFAKVLLPNASVLSGPVPDAKKGADGRVSFDQDLPKTEECPLNGAKYSKQQRQWWEGHRPLGVMIENHQESRPQSGLSSADVVYEAVAEGGITRFLAVFYCQDAGTVGAVRSARTYFLDFISEYGTSPLYAHVGGANTPGPANALGQIEDYGWASYNDLNQFSIGFPAFWRDYERLGHPVATEHTMYSDTTKLWDYAKEKRELGAKDEDGNLWDEDFVKYSFKDDAPASARPAAQTVAFDFWDGYKDYSVAWTYDKASNVYLRSNGGVKHLDLNTKKQIGAKNVVILYMTERNANDGYENNAHMLYGTKGTGNAVVFQDGKQVPASWSKADRQSRLIVKDKSGNEIKYTRGAIWFQVLATGSAIDVK